MDAPHVFGAFALFHSRSEGEVWGLCGWSARAPGRRLRGREYGANAKGEAFGEPGASDVQRRTTNAKQKGKRMKTRTKVAIITAPVAVVAFLLSPILFPPADTGVAPTSAQIPFFIFLGVGDALLLGLGISFLIFGYPLLRKVSPDSKARAWAMYLSIGYLMVSWYPHLGMHASNGLDMGGLLMIDLIFHLPLEVAGAVLAYCAYSLFKSWRGGKLAEAIRSEDAALAGEVVR